jgi:hypothetical protein
MATVPTPYDATSGVTLSDTIWDAGVRDPLNFLLDPPHCSVYAGATVSCVSNTATLLTYDTETDDTDTMHSTSSNTGRITFNTAGRYMLTIFTMLVNPPTAYRVYSVNVRLNAAGSSSGGTSIRTFEFAQKPADFASTVLAAGPQQTIALTRVFNALDYIEVFLTQYSGGSARTTDSGAGQFGTGIQARWVGIS